MKKRLILLLTVFITFVGSFAQQTTSSQRLKFMGKSMDCSMSEMATYLQTKGCKIKINEEDLISMTGTFQGYLDCEFVLAEYNMLKCCIILLPSSYGKSWTELESDYNRIVDKFTQKYGAPDISVSKFEGNPYSDYEKLNLVENDKCYYRSIFLIEGGAVSIGIRSIGSLNRVTILYSDNITRDRIEKLQQSHITWMLEIENCGIVAKGKISIYPNPATDVITVTNEGVNSVAVYSVAGYLVASSESNVVNVANLVPGIYVVAANTEAGVITGQIRITNRGL